MAGERVVGKDPKRGPKHLRPSTAAINAERKAQGALPIGEFAAAPPAWVGPDTDVLFLYVEFNDLGCSFTPAQMQANMFGATATGPGNLADYYDEISYGALQIDGQVVGDAAGTDCIPLGNSHDFYDGAGGAPTRWSRTPSPRPMPTWTSPSSTTTATASWTRWASSMPAAARTMAARPTTRRMVPVATASGRTRWRRAAGDRRRASRSTRISSIPS